jgi:predicted PurR-regulated permease PerM
MWMFGKVLSMIAVGALTWLGLGLLGIPLALSLAVLAAALTFIPNFGPVLSAVPAVLLGLMNSPARAAYVALLYVGIQTAESYVLTPIFQKKAGALPPALLIVAQVAMGSLSGGIGLAVATPLTAALLVLVRHLYVEDVLSQPQPPG